MTLTIRDSQIYGQMPDGSWKPFDSKSQYESAYLSALPDFCADEDEYYDRLFDLYNGFEWELPEDF